MPNHVYNTIELSGDAIGLVRVMKKVSMPRPGAESKVEFDFHNLITPSGMEQYKDSENWYDWNVANWGTKWNAYDVTVTDHIDHDHPYLNYSFSTAWSPPYGIIVTLAEYITENCPGVSMYWHYEEEQGWGGIMQCGPGTGLVCVDEWDIPSSHEELVERKGVCYCQQDEDYSPFGDCPRYEE